MTTATVDVDLHWSQRGLCRDNPELFDGFTETDRHYARSMCRRCPVLAKCDEWRLTQVKSNLIGIIAGVSYGK